MWALWFHIWEACFGLLWTDWELSCYAAPDIFRLVNRAHTEHLGAITSDSSLLFLEEGKFSFSG